MKVSIVLPTFNESGNIINLIHAIKLHVPERWKREIIVADDNSPDGTAKLVEDTFPGDPEVKVIVRTSDRGLARSIRTGVEAATGDQIVVMDTDFTHDPGEIPKLLHVAEVFDIVSGSRFCAGGSMQDTQHYLASLFYNWFMRIVLRTQVQDNLGGYFTIKTEKLRCLPAGEIFFGYGDYFFRLLHFAQQQGMTVVEIPACYRARRAGRSKSNFIKMLWGYTGAMLRLRMSRRLASETSLRSVN
jgi:dolichol-phosphate mannosyltransferase